MRLRPYQEEALWGVRRAIAGGSRRVVLVAPTGAGKTVMAAEMIRSAVERGTHVLFLAHRDELITQASGKLVGVKVDHGIIKAGADVRRPWCKVQVASIQTLAARHLRPGKTAPLPPAGLVIIDEAHRTMGDTYKSLVARYGQAAIVGLTATPCRLDGQGLGDIYQELVIAARVEDLVAEGSLVNPTVYAPAGGAVQVAGVKKTAGDYNQGQLAEAMARESLVGDIVGHWLKLGRNERTVVFATGIEHALMIRAAFRAAGVSAEVVSGKTPKIERERTLRDLRTGALRVVVNCAVLIEGWDLPACSVAVLARPTKSVTVYLQSVGRILRPAPEEGKDRALILDHAGCVHEHGLPTSPREWTLEGSREKAPAVRQCPECFAVVAGGARECSECGFVWPEREATEREIIETDATQDLVQITSGQAIVRGPELRPYDGWLRAYWRERPTADDKQASYDAIAGRWFERQGGMYPWKTGAIAAKYRALWGVWPRGQADRCPHRDAIEAAKERERLAVIEEEPA